MGQKENPVITLSSDFEKQSQGVGNMEGVIYSVNPDARVIHLVHGIPHFSIIGAARTMETAYFMPRGIHVCVVDPGVGTERRALILQVKRGDFFVGPDNGCLMTVPRLLGGIKKIVEISNKKLMNEPVSPIFHGRDVFAPAAAHLSLGVEIEKFGKELEVADCVKAPFEEAFIKGDKIEAMVIHKNHFGSVHLNILAEEWDNFRVGLGEVVQMSFPGKKIKLQHANTFGEVKKDDAVILKDDYNRVEVAINQGNFSQKLGLDVGQKVVISKK